MPAPPESVQHAGILLAGLATGLGAVHEPPSLRQPAQILLVDDEPLILSSLSRMLSQQGHWCHCADSGAQAIHQLLAAPVDLVLLDLRLPDLSGHAVMDWINQHQAGVPVIMMSGDTGIEAAIGALQRGAQDFLRKPFAPSEVLRAVQQALKQRSLQLDNQRMHWRLTQSERMYRYLVNSSPDLIFTLDAAGQITFINDRCESQLGLERQGLLGAHYTQLIHEEDQDHARYVFLEHRERDSGARQLELRLKCPLEANGERAFELTLLTMSVEDGRQPPARHIVGTYAVARDVSDRNRAEALISYQAYHDILTDLPNRALFRDRLGLAVIQARRNQSQLAVMFLDLDRFKPINDTLGHASGDELLRQVALRLRECLRRGDTLARLGGDEFTLLLPDLLHRDAARTIADKCLSSLEQPFHLGHQEVRIGASIGIAIYPDDGGGLDELVRHADIAMYHVKTQGKNAHAFYDPAMQAATQRRVALEQGLRQALKRRELRMHYQPQLNRATGEVVGAEALMRWQHPTRGLLSAGEFLPVAEEAGLIGPLSDWMLDEVCRVLADWQQRGLPPVRIAVNLSPQVLERQDFADAVRQALATHAVPSTQLEVEITENICIQNPQHAIEHLNRIAALGVGIAIDDFGTGYSSLAYLHRFPVHTLKIDQSFVRDIQDPLGKHPVVRAVISIAQGLGLSLVAEGVETDIQADYLLAAGCAVMQGYHFARPMPIEQLEAFVAQLSVA